MNGAPVYTIELNEHVRREFDALSPQQNRSVELATELWRSYSSQVLVEFPSPKTGNRWALTPSGWVGQIPLSRELLIRLNPKVEIQSVLRMLEYAFRLREIGFPEGIVHAESLSDALERLATVFARRVMARARKGLHREYVAKSGDVGFLRGRLLIDRAYRAPWKTTLPCRYAEQTVDIPDNRVLAWTLFLLARSGVGRQQSGDLVGKAFRALHGAVTLEEHSADDCLGRQYTRLNEDYEALHALARFFLAHTAPTHRAGGDAMLPFLIEMPRLFESFVAEWLRKNVAHNQFRVTSQECVVLREQSLEFKIDVVLRDAMTDMPVCVLDTKYKAGTVTNADIYQVVTYAKLLGCREAFLVYPAALDRRFSAQIGDVRVRSLTFDIGDDVEVSGQIFLSELLKDMAYQSPRAPHFD